METTKKNSSCRYKECRYRNHLLFSNSCMYLSIMNLIDALDEMQICNIGKYVITDIAEADEFLIKNFYAKGGLSQNLADN